MAKANYKVAEIDRPSWYHNIPTNKRQDWKIDNFKNYIIGTLKDEKFTERLDNLEKAIESIEDVYQKFNRKFNVYDNPFVDIEKEKFKNL